MDQRFGSQERLKRSTDIDALFSRGRRFFCYPFKVLYMPRMDLTQSNQVLFSVPRRLVPLAVDRNLIKRRTREAYRLSRPILGQESLWIAFVYQMKDCAPYAAILQAVQQSMDRICREMKKRSPSGNRGPVPFL